MKPIHFYYLGIASWFMAYGIQFVGFAWIVTIVLNESAKMVGFAQMAFLAPAMFFMLIGGSLADQFGGRKIAILGHILASSAPLFLTIVVITDNLTYSTVIIFAIIMGCAQALITPARDGLLALLAEGEIQRKVVQVSMIQFGVQMFGFLAASFADSFGALYILSLQFIFLLLGAVAYYKLDIQHTETIKPVGGMVHQITQSITTGYRTVRASRDMSAIVIQNCGMGMFFMGSYMVTIPLLIRESYQGDATELSMVNVANSIGLVVTNLLLLRFGIIKRPGRALLIAHFLGCFALAGSGLGLGFISLVGFIFCWGLCLGITMSMSRTIMQEKSPPDQRARMMAFFSFSFMGAGPIGSMLSGFLVDWYGAPTALMISSFMMLTIVILVTLKSSLWHLRI